MKISWPAFRIATASALFPIWLTASFFLTAFRYRVGYVMAGGSLLYIFYLIWRTAYEHERYLDLNERS